MRRFINCLGYVASSRKCVSNEDVRNEVVVVYFKLLSWHFVEGLRKISKLLKTVSRSIFELGTSRFAFIALVYTNLAFGKSLLFKCLIFLLRYYNGLWRIKQVQRLYLVLYCTTFYF